MIDTPIFTEVTITGLTVYGLALLFIKALLILLLAQTLSDQFEFSPASIRHSIWFLALSSLAALPVLTIILPAWQLLSIELVTAPALEIGTGLDQIAMDSVVTPAVLSTADWLVIGYLLLVTFRLSLLLIEIVKVGWVTSSAKNAEDEWYRLAACYFDGRIKIKVSGALDGPVTWGTLFPVILLPQDCQRWAPLEREMVLRHEIGHIQRRDWLAQLLGQLVAVLYWPVPGISRALRSLSLEAERACDDVVLGDGVTPADYAALLLRQAKVNRLQATVALGKPSELAQRIRHIVNAYVDRAGEKRTRFWLATVAGIFILPFASIQAIGSIPQGGPLAGMILTPVLMVPEPKKSIAPVNNSADVINKPVRPGLVINPPEGPLPEPSLAMTGVVSDEVMPKAVASTINDLDVQGFTATRPVVRTRRQPEYPALAKRRGIEGRVVVEFDIDAEGGVTNARVIEAEPALVFNRSALKAIDGYQYEPYRQGGETMGLKGLKEQFRFQLIEEKPTRRASSGDSRAGQKQAIDSG